MLLDKTKKEDKTMDIYSLLEFLKFFWLLFEVVRYFIHRQKEKELAFTVEKLSQRLLRLEKSLKEKSDND
jgi:predicted secreted acid phosphatase